MHFFNIKRKLNSSEENAYNIVLQVGNSEETRLVSNQPLLVKALTQIFILKGENENKIACLSGKICQV